MGWINDQANFKDHLLVFIVPRDEGLHVRLHMDVHAEGYRKDPKARNIALDQIASFIKDMILGANPELKEGLSILTIKFNNSTACWESIASHPSFPSSESGAELKKVMANERVVEIENQESS